MRPNSAPIRRLLLPALAAGALLFAACGDDDTSTSADDTGADTGSTDTGSDTGSDGGTAGAVQDGPVQIVDFAYDPVDIIASPGQEITFDNADSTAHTATATDNSYNTGSIQGGESGTATAPDAPGEYPFFCSFHPFMKGTVTVQ